MLPWPGLFWGLCLALLALFYLWQIIRPGGGGDLPRAARRLRDGRALLWIAAVSAALQLGLFLALVVIGPPHFGPAARFSSIVSGLLLIAILLIGALARLFAASRQLTLGERLRGALLWWFPVLNLFIFHRIYTVTGREARLITVRHLRNRVRAARKVCKTKYPLLLVHGIFFRDWKTLGYWGRIPHELESNGATVFYGQQQSSASVEDCARELKARILRIRREVGCEKVNIIAHSKGGLDARYAIGLLGMDKYVASLTTINTPHRGCVFAREALETLPDRLVRSVSGTYNRIFRRLGDKHPDFFSGVSELTDRRCAELNELLPPSPGVVYQSVGSKMRDRRSAGFPLNLSYRIVRTLDGENDGLVAVPSMPWGDFTMLTPAGRRGISHVDVIDLTRKDVPGFDVCEFYVDMVSGLKDRGL